MNENATVTFTEPGVNTDKLDPSALPGKAKAKLQGLLEQIKRS